MNDLLDSGNPRAAIQALQPQVLYSIVAQIGLSSAVEVLDLASKEQLTSIIDFHVWQKDEIDLEKLIDVLACTDATDSLDLLGKIVRAIDLKIIALLISRYVSVISLDDPSETPFENGFVTPDNGSTWLRVETSNQDLHFNISRVLAYIYESNLQLFYQLISIPTVHTASMLEEEAYLEREKRLQALGFPDEEVSFEICTPLPPHDLKYTLEKLSSLHGTQEIIGANEEILIEATIPFQISLPPKHTSRASKLAGLVKDSAEFEAEFGFLLNCTLMRWHVDLSEIQTVGDMAERVRGAIELGLELTANLRLTELSSFEAIGLRGLFRAGLWHLLELRKIALAIRAKADLLDLNRPISQLLEALTEDVPALPDWWQPGMTFESMPEAPFISRGITTLEEITDLKRLLPLICAT